MYHNSLFRNFLPPLLFFLPFPPLSLSIPLRFPLLPRDIFPLLPHLVFLKSPSPPPSLLLFLFFSTSVRWERAIFFLLSLSLFSLFPSVDFSDPTSLGNLSFFFFFCFYLFFFSSVHFCDCCSFLLLGQVRFSLPSPFLSKLFGPSPPPPLQSLLRIPPN